MQSDSQLDKFKHATRDLENDDEARIAERVGELVKYKPVEKHDEQ